MDLYLKLFNGSAFTGYIEKSTVQQRASSEALAVVQHQIHHRDIHFPASFDNEESYRDENPNWKRSRSSPQASWQTSFAGATINGNIYFGSPSEEKKDA
jgi:hypothetical protein